MYFNLQAGRQSPVLHRKMQTIRNTAASNCDLLVYRLRDTPSPSVSPSAATANTVKLYIVPGMSPVISVLVTPDVRFVLEVPFTNSILYV